MKNPTSTTISLIEEVMRNYFIHQNCSEMIVRGLRFKAEKGIYPGKAPMGYKNTKSDNNECIIAIDIETAPFVRKAYELSAEGKSAKEISEALYNIGCRNKKGDQVSIKRVKHILQNPIYTGKFNYSGKLYYGIHEPIISEELFNKVQVGFEHNAKIQTAKRIDHFQRCLMNNPEVISLLDKYNIKLW